MAQGYDMKDAYIRKLLADQFAYEIELERSNRIKLAHMKAILAQVLRK